jgi:hypothetical protein
MVNSNPTGPPPLVERKTTRWMRPGRTLFKDAAPPPGNLLLRRPNLHYRSKNRRSPTHPRARGPPEPEETGVLIGGSTERLPCTSLNCTGERLRERVSRATRYR